MTELPREVQIEVTGACNLRCRMCLVRYRPALDRGEGSLPFEAFRQVVDALPALTKVTLQGLGEPLLAPDLLRMVEHANARGLRVGFNSNGTLLTRAMAERLVDAGLDWLHVSLDGATAATYEAIRDGARFERVVRNLRDLVDVVRGRGGERPTIMLVFVAMRRNLHELPALVRLAADVGVREVRVQNLSHSFEDTGAAPEYREIRAFTATEALWDADARVAAILGEAGREAARLGVALRLPETGPAAPRAAGTPGCDWPWHSAYVRHDGGVQPCCMLMGEDRAILGALREARFADIWRSEAYESFRAALRTDSPPDVCRGCSLYRGIF